MGDSPDDQRDGWIDVGCSDGVRVLTLHGEHDVSTQPTLREELELVGQASGPVVVDMSHATFIDSTVLSALAQHRQQVRAPATFAVVAPTGYQGSRLVELLGLGTLIPVYPTRADAIAAVGD